MPTTSSVHNKRMQFKNYYTVVQIRYNTEKWICYIILWWFHLKRRQQQWNFNYSPKMNLKCIEVYKEPLVKGCISKIVSFFFLLNDFYDHYLLLEEFYMYYQFSQQQANS